MDRREMQNEKVGYRPLGRPTRTCKRSKAVPYGPGPAPKTPEYSAPQDFLTAGT